VYAARRRQFLSAMRKHEQALDNYRRATARGAHQGLPRTQALEAVRRSGQELNTAFQLEVNSARQSAIPRSTMQTPGGKRVPDRVRNSLKITRLDLRSIQQAANVSMFARVAKILSPGLLVVDIAARGRHVHDMHKPGDDWHREVFVEIGGLLGSAGAGAAGSFLSIIVIGGTVFIFKSPALSVAVGTGAISATAHAIDGGDFYGKLVAGKIYDQVAHLMKR
ncbi:hypothetical protein, partial [Thiomonas sp. FB-6]|uniref:hypothetical protein n=1 Tax=Thiomonas sp. FB-6 TaxID=1158291 RepID=UPI00037B1035